MSLTTLAAVNDALPGRKYAIQKTGSAATMGTAATFLSCWLKGTLPAAGATPPTGSGEVPTSATTGAIPIVNPGSGATLYTAAFGAALKGSTGSLAIMLMDRLVHTSGLNANITTTQTFSSAAVNRPDSTGADVIAFMEVYATLGTTGTTYTFSYTNQAGTTGRTGTVVVSGTGRLGDMYAMSLQSGDTGVRSVESVILTAGSGAVGNFGITLARPVILVTANGSAKDVPRQFDWMDNSLRRIQSDACLMIAQANTGTSDIMGYLSTIEG